MREIKFRGKRIDNGEWIYGYVLNGMTSGTAVSFILLHGSYMFQVDPQTVGQYTGLKDKDGVEIYEGDVVACYNEENYRVDDRGNELYDVPRDVATLWDSRCGSEVVSTEAVVFSSKSGTYEALMDCTHDGDYLKDLGRVEVIGNIHDNPELLEDPK